MQGLCGPMPKENASSSSKMTPKMAPKMDPQTLKIQGKSGPETPLTPKNAKKDGNATQKRGAFYQVPPCEAQNAAQRAATWLPKWTQNGAESVPKMKQIFCCFPKRFGEGFLVDFRGQHGPKLAPTWDQQSMRLAKADMLKNLQKPKGIHHFCGFAGSKNH